MRFTDPNQPAYRVLNILLLYTFTLEILIPAASAMQDISYNSRQNSHFYTSIPGTNRAQAPIATTLLHTEALPASPVQQSVSASGPRQTESSGFSLNTMDGMVDKFTGDFSYSIPLMDVEGYPITLSYNSNVGMHDEASWVGLGWNLNVGSITREMRGIPDEFNGDQKIKRTYNLLEDNTTEGKKLGAIGGFYYGTDETAFKAGGDFTLLWGNYKNTYVGKGKTFDFGVGSKLSIGDPLYFGARFGLGYNADSKNGVGRSTSVGLVGGYFNNKGQNAEAGLSWGSHYGSRTGVTQRSLSLPLSGGILGSSVQLGLFGSTFSTGTLTSVPRLELNRTSKTNNLIGDVKVNYTTGAIKMSLGIEGQLYSTTQQFEYSDQANQIIYNPAYGYFHSEKRDAYPGTDNPVMDFNRARDQELSAETKNLTFSFPTYDIFHVNGMGISASFRGQRNDIGTYHDGTNKLVADGVSNTGMAGVVFGTSGLALSAGYIRGNQEGGITSGKWNSSAGALNFSGNAGTLFFKGIGEPTPRKSSLLEAMQTDAPLSIQLQKSSDGKSIERTANLVYAGGTSAFSSAALNALNASEPDIRANVYNPVTAIELFSRPIVSYPAGQFANPVPTPAIIGRMAGARESNHLSGVEVITAEGLRYEYGIPAYSIKQSEVAFSTNKTTEDFAGLVTYSNENSISNTAGRAHLYDKTEVPAYAHSFLLTGMFSSDYTDRTNNGPSLDDYGSYYQVNHTLFYDNTNPYRWRFPISGNGSGGNKALFNRGLLATDLDNMANYSYGEKEIWYTHSIESRNFVAEFELADRKDAYAVLNENGMLDVNKPLQLLKTIKLYNRNERRNNPNAKPVQTIEFFYDYSLCRNNPANKDTYASQYASSGKLTLKEIRVYSGPVSQETALAPYIFEYSTQNPDHSYVNTDRWGKYKPDNATRPNNLFPYAAQDPAQANLYAQSWKIVKITSPMGGEMEIKYEADNYAFVQDRRAMEHVDIHGYMNPLELLSLSQKTSWNGTSSYISNALSKKFSLLDLRNIVDAAVPGWSLNPANIARFLVALLHARYGISNDLSLFQHLNSVPSNVVVVKLNQAIPGYALTREGASQVFREAYLKDVHAAPIQKGLISELYLRNFVRLKSGDSDYEMVPTFAGIDQGTVGLTDAFPFAPIPATGVLPPNANGDYEYGYIVLNTTMSDENSGNIPMHPVQKTAMEFARLHLTDKVYGSCDGCDPNLNIDKKVFWKGNLYKQMDDYGYCKTVNLSLSTTRLMDHDGIKYGGNARVNQIIYRDKWNNISGEYDAEYYWNYFYGRSQTFGVAAYEPTIGNDENPFYRWNTYKNKSVSFPDESRFTEDPATAALFPAPVVGYSEVAVELGGNYVNTDNRLGKSITEFYTAKEKPTYTISTPLQKVESEKHSILNTEIRLYGLSQGHVIVTNDFHGKSKGHRIYNGKDQLQETSEYIYRDGLSKVNTLDRDGSMYAERIACEYDISADTRFIRSTASTRSIGATGVFPLPFFFPFFIYPVFSQSSRESGFYTSVINKHINYSAVLERVETNVLGSANSAESLVYDRYSGHVILSSLKDEYNDPLYSLQYPAHWYYANFTSPAMHGTNALTGTMTAGNFAYSSALTDILLPGDYVRIEKSGVVSFGHVLSVSGNSAKLINETGAAMASPTGTGCILYLIRSGRKNRLYETMQTLTTKRNPISGTTFIFPASTGVGIASGVLDISAVSFKERYNVWCKNAKEDQIGSLPRVAEGSVLNPFVYGLKNNLVPEHTYTIQTAIDQSQVQGIRFNGTLTDYKPFYALNPTDHKWYKITESGHPGHNALNPLQHWRSQGEAITFDPYGKALEGKDPLDVFSSVVYGYNRIQKLVPTAQAVNARQNEIGFDGFEDYDYYLPVGVTYDMGHFDFGGALSASVTVSNAEKHSGLKSLRINPGHSATVGRTVSGSCTLPENGLTDDLYVVDNCMCIKPFSPTPGDYIIGAWLKATTLNGNLVYTAPRITVTVLDNSSVLGSFNFTPSGKILDGWQRLEGEFSIPQGATIINITLENTSGSENIYVDDIRVHPFLAGMTTTVYDPATLLPIATHDGYNYTTFYNYDENLSPVRVRVETTEGIQTISETESSTLKKFKQQ